MKWVTTWLGHVVTSLTVSIVWASQLTVTATIDPTPQMTVRIKVPKDSSHARSISMVKTRKMRAMMEHLARHRVRMERISEAKKLYKTIHVSTHTRENGCGFG